MFDVNSPFEIPSFRAAGGTADVVVRWPTDEEWNLHHKKSKTIMQQLGRGQSETKTESGEADLKLYEAIKVNGAPQLTLGEAAAIIGAIKTCDVLGVELGGDEAEVSLQLPNNEAKHWVKIPNMDQIREYHRTTRLITLPYSRFEIRSSLEAAVRLWDKCQGRVEGYEGNDGKGPVPNIHKDVAIRAVIQAIEQEVTPKHAENF